MRGITISDHVGTSLSFDLVDLLRVIGPTAVSCEWEITGLECVGERAEELHHLSDERARISGEELVCLVGGLTQVIDGVFSAYRNGEKTAWVKIRAVDSTAFDVVTRDFDVVSRLKNGFREVSEFDP